MGNALTRWLSRLGICAVVGAMTGAIVGLVYGLTLVAVPAHTLPFQQALIVSVVLGLIVWLAVVIALVVVGGYPMAAVLLTSFVTCMVVSICTVFLLNALHRPFAGMFGMLTGWLLGLVIGFLFCKLCNVHYTVSAES